LNCSRKKFGPNFKELWNFLPKKLSLSSQKYEFGIRDPGSEIRDPGSGINLFRIPDPGVKKDPIPDPGSGSATLLKSHFEEATKQHKSKYFFFFVCVQTITDPGPGGPKTYGSGTLPQTQYKIL
jgi:hypothetical protein